MKILNNRNTKTLDIEFNTSIEFLFFKYFSLNKMNFFYEEHVTKWPHCYLWKNKWGHQRKNEQLAVFKLKGINFQSDYRAPGEYLEFLRLSK